MATDTDDQLSRLSRLWRGYAAKVYGSYSPLNSSMALAVSGDRQLLRLVSDCPPHAHDPNMLLAVVQYLVRGGIDHPIAACYSDFDAAVDLGPLLRDLWSNHGGEIDDLMAARRIQTNECGRAPALALGLMAAAGHMGSDRVGLIDAGASAGLNLALDAYLLSFGSAGSVGPADSTVRIGCEMRGALPAVAGRLPTIEHRIGLDREPVDLSDERNVRWLMSCIWPGTGRHERAAAALEMAASRPPAVRRADMVGDLGATIDEMGDLPTVVVTSWSYSYLPPDAQARFQQVLAEAGAARPVAWVCADTVGVVDRFEVPEGTASGDLVPGLLGMAVFDKGGVDSRSLAYIQPHGSWVEWFGTP